MKMLAELLFESNFSNSGKQNITISSETESETIYSFEAIFEIMKLWLHKKYSEVDNYNLVEKYFTSTFKNWLKNDATGYQQLNHSWPSVDVFYKTLYPSTVDIIQHLAEELELSEEEILAQFPSYVKTNMKGSTIFLGGRRFKFQRTALATIVEHMVDYIVPAVNRHPDVIQHPNLILSDITKITVPDMLQRSVIYHQYIENKNKKISLTDAKEQYKSLHENHDYTVIEVIDNVEFRLVKSVPYLQIEGKWMNHCVGGGSYTNSTIVSVVPKQLGVSVCTLEFTDKTFKTANQTKGRSNSYVNTEFHDVIWKFLLKHDATTKDKKMIGDEPSKEVREFIKNNS